MSAELKAIRSRLAGLLRDVDALLADEPATKASAPDDGRFDEWWAAYPLKTAKGGARTSYRTALKKASHEALLNGLKSYAFSDDRKYIPMATTWLNQERWADEQVERTSPAQGNNAQSYDSVLDELFRD